MVKKLLAVAALLFICVGNLAAQAPKGWDPAGLQLTRTELQELLTRYEATAASTSYSDVIKERAKSEAALIRQRLAEGDMRVGDRIFLVVQLPDKVLSDTFNVSATRTISLPDMGDVPLTGVLRSELESYLTGKISQFIRNPVVHATSLLRLEITGAVRSPGYYTVPSDFLITDALMAAGGPTSEAKSGRATVTRSGETIWNAADLQQAMTEGRTLDQISLRAGDAIVVEQKKAGSGIFRSVLTVLGGMGSLLIVLRQLRGK
jgi:protein involved in polysaccharide export with SLBB domain